MQINLNEKRCIKQTTIAIIHKDGEYWLGTNSCKNPQKECPRYDALSGFAYEKCKNVCKQTGHAEVNALLAAGKNAKGGDLYLIGHTYICKNCKEAMDKAGIKNSYLVGEIGKKTKEK